MDYKSKNEVCDFCQKEIEEVIISHGFVYNSFFCPHCGKENKSGYISTQNTINEKIELIKTRNITLKDKFIK
jgi:predicted amidophosphoribosyltransferase